MSPGPKSIETKGFRFYWQFSQHFIFSVTYAWAQ